MFSKRQVRAGELIHHLVKKTPRASKDVVEAYHDKIKARLDSGVIFQIPSRLHCALHQLVWLEGCEIYAHLNNLDKASEIYCEHHQPEAFNFWYVENYINANNFDRDEREAWEFEKTRKAMEEADIETIVSVRPIIPNRGKPRLTQSRLNPSYATA